MNNINPLYWSDLFGLYTEVLIGQFTLSLNSIQGHAAININGTVYSRDSHAIEKVNARDYIAAQKAFRNSVGLVLDLTPEQESNLVKFLEEARKENKKYSVGNNNCADTVSNALESIGLIVRGPWQYSYPMAPADLYHNLLKTGKVTNRNYYPKVGDE